MEIKSKLSGLSEAYMGKVITLLRIYLSIVPVWKEDSKKYSPFTKALGDSGITEMDEGRVGEILLLAKNVLEQNQLDK